MEQQVLAKHGSKIAFLDRGGVKVLDFLQIADRRLVGGKRDEFGGAAFDQGANQIELLDLVDAVIAHRSTTRSAQQVSHRSGVASSHSPIRAPPRDSEPIADGADLTGSGYPLASEVLGVAEMERVRQRAG